MTINNSNESIYSQIASRLNLQTIANFIREGEDIPHIDKRSFDAREKSAYNELETLLEKFDLDKESKDDILSQIISYMTTVSDIYFSLGMKAGATLVIKLTDSFETDI